MGAEWAGLGEDQRRLVVLPDGKIVVAHLVPGVEPMPARGAEPPEPVA